MILMTEIYEIVKDLATPLMNSLLVFRNKYNIKNFQVLSMDLRKTVI